MSELTVDSLPIPGRRESTVVVPAPCPGPGCWAGAPSAALGEDGAFYLAYRVRHPLGEGRGRANVVARSEDGVEFETLVSLDRDAFGAESLERPALVATPGGRWHLYVSCATPGTKHWRVDLLEADDPAEFDPERRRTVLPGDRDWGVKDPVILVRDSRFHLWLCCHPLERDEDADRMLTRYGTSDDGIEFELHGVALAGRAGHWDSRGARVTSVLPGSQRSFAFYDGRASAEENTEERTGIAAGDEASGLRSVSDAPVAVSPHGSGSLRYVAVLPLPSGGHQLFYEIARADGAHELRSEHAPPAAHR